MHSSIGKLQYSGENRLAVEVDPELAAYYRHLIPKWIDTNPQKWPAHITVVRETKEVVVNRDSWGKYQGESVQFFYSPIVHHGQVYFWLNVFCVRLEEIRAELGLPVRSEYTIPPDGFTKCFHMTLANRKFDI